MIRQAGVPVAAVQLHATAFVMGSRGIMVTGPSGAGKSLLALSVIEQEVAAGRHACLVADDGVLAAALGGRLAVFAPVAIAGLAEARGYGPSEVEHEAAAIVDLEVELSVGSPPDRYQAGNMRERLGVVLPLLIVDTRALLGAMTAVRAALRAL